MIISASRRTDIPAFYAEWLINRIRAGYCTVPNPFNRNQVGYVSLTPAEVEVIVFWTRNPRPLFPYLAELDQRGYRYYFQYTVMNNPRPIDPKSPPLVASLKTFQELADRIGPERVIWRYDPIVFSNLTSVQFHRETYTEIAQALRGYTFRSVISLVDDYRKAAKRIRDLAQEGVEIVAYEGRPSPRFDQFMYDLVKTAHTNEIEIVSCAEEINLQSYGMQPGRCVDDDYIEKVFGLAVQPKKDPTQRDACGCVISKDIGMYDSCLFGCQYCYATTSFERAKTHYQEHNPESPSLVGWYEAEAKPKKGESDKPLPSQQISLF